jgi:hypothetical protein
MLDAVSSKSGRIAELIRNCEGRGWSPHYLGYFECFNRGLYFEAHDVLEELWLADRQGPNYAFHKGLIQLAGAFVHLQKERLKPAVALFNLATANLAKYPDAHDGLALNDVRELIDSWRGDVMKGQFSRNPLRERPAPRLALPTDRGFAPNH